MDSSGEDFDGGARGGAGLARFLRSDPGGAACAALLSLAMSIAVAWRSGVPFETSGVFFDGHLYLEIARTFPLPYSPDGLLYTGQAPGFPAAIALARALVPDGWLNWAQLAVVVW